MKYLKALLVRASPDEYVEVLVTLRASLTLGGLFAFTLVTLEGRGKIKPARSQIGHTNRWAVTYLSFLAGGGLSAMSSSIVALSDVANIWLCVQRHSSCWS